MAKSVPGNMCRQAFRNEKYLVKGKIKNDKTAVWEKNEQEIKAMVESRPKIQYRYSDDKNKQNFIKKLCLRDTRIWFGERHHGLP